MRRSQSILLVGILAVAINLRPAISSVSPVLERIHVDVGLSYTALGLLTTIPTLCMGVFALAVPFLSRRYGRERAVFWGVVLVLAATAARIGSRNVAVLFGSTVLVGVGIAVTQALLPPLVTEYFPDRESFTTGLYTASLTVGAALASAVTAPIADALDSWPIALAVWGVLAAIAIPIWYACWRGAAKRRTRRDETIERARFPWRSRWAWVLTLFFGGSSGLFFFVLTWLAPRYVALGWAEHTAGFVLAAFLAVQLAGNLSVSAVGDRFEDRRPLFVLMLALCAAGAVGVAYAPEMVPYGWAALLGAGSAGVFTLSLTLPIQYADSPAATDGLTSMMLGGGYPIAALAPLLAGAVYDATDDYAVVFGLLAVLAIVLLGISVLFRPSRGPVSASGR